MSRSGSVTRFDKTSEPTWPGGRRAAVSLTFDDARVSQVDRGLPVLDRYGVRATFYISPHLAEQRVSQWRAAIEKGHEIGNHTLTHPCSGNFPFARDKALEDYTLERMAGELSGADDAIRAMLGVAPTTFAYPCGQTFVGRGAGVRSYVPLVAERFAAGRCAFSEAHNAPAVCDLWQLYAMDSDDRAFDALRAMVDAAAADGGWLVLCGHDVGDAGRRQTTAADALDALCRYARDHDADVWFDTVANVAAHVAKTQAAGIGS
jgi:peptidoglycan-N-acetylglucosamine deacetylase